MQRTRRLVALLIVLVVVAAGDTAADEIIDDVVDIVATGGQLIAAVEGRRFFREEIHANETILWQGARGEVGAVLTSERLMAVSTMSGQWNIRPLRISEKSRTPDMLIGTHLVLMLTDERILAFGTRTDGFFQTRIPVGERVGATAAEGRVAAAVTSARAFGFSTFRRGAAEIRFRRGETFVSMKTTTNKVTLQTSQRLITIVAEEAAWRSIDL